MVQSIPFSEAQTFNLANANTIFVNIDDRYSNTISLPFTFCFYGSAYNNMVIGANVTISFNTAQYANQQSGSEMCDVNNNYYALPQPNNISYPLNAIYALFHDIDPSINNNLKKIEWKVIGTAPCRKMVINWVEVAHYRPYNNNSCNNFTSTFQCVLYENTNVIDIFVLKKLTCPAWNCGAGLIGIQNSNGTQFATPPNRNTSQFSISANNSEGWRFIPNGASLLVNNQVQLLNSNNTVIETVTPAPGVNGVITANFTTPACILGSATSAKYYVSANYLPCSGSNLQVKDSILLVKNIPPAPVVNDTVKYCRNATAIALTAQGVGLRWYASLSATNFTNTGPIPNTTTPGLQTYYVASFSNNCESVRVPVYVLIKDYAYGTLNASICQGDSLLFNGVYYKAATNSPKDTFTRANNQCDSIVSLNLTVNPDVQVTTTINICSNQLPFTWNGMSITQGGNGVATFSAIGSNTCDSITTLNLVENPSKRDTLTLTKCENEMPFSWNGFSITQACTAVATFNGFTSANCDSIVVLNVMVRDTFRFVETQSTCANSFPYVWRGITVNQGGNAVASKIYTSQYGCDSVYVLNLNVQNVIITQITDEICANQLPITRNNHTVNSVGTFNFADTFTALQSNCDSIVRWTVTIKVVDTVNVNMTICSNQLPYTWNGITVNQAGLRVATKVNTGTNACDSITFLNLTVHPVYRDTITLTKCYTEMTFSWNGYNISQPGSAVATYSGQTSNGCDSILVLNVIRYDTFLTTETLTVCYNSLPYTWRGITVTQGGNNIATKVYPNQFGCDSTYKLNLNVTNAIQNTITPAICESQLPYTINGHTVNTFGSFTFRDTFISILYNCDSIVTVNLMVSEKDSIATSVTICSNQLPLTWNGITVNQGGNHVAYYSTLGNDGCDSVTILNLVVIPVVNYTVADTICESALPFIWNGISVAQGGNIAAIFTTLSSKGCDSIAQLNLTVKPTLRDTVNIFNCENQFPFMWNGINVAQGGPSAAIFNTTSLISLCDSIVVLNVQVNDTVINRVSQTVCQTDMPYTWNGITVTQGGNNAASFVTNGVNGCDSTTILNLQVINTVLFTQNLSVCQAQMPYTWNGIVVSQGGTNVAQFTTSSGTGCDSVTQLNLTVKPTIYAVINRSICANTLPYTWNGITVNQFGDSVAQYTMTSPRTGCDSVAYLNLHALEVKNNVDSIFICYTDIPYNYAGTMITASGNYTGVFNGVNGCDSIVGLVATVGLPRSRLPDSVISNCGSVVFRNQTYTHSIMLDDTLKDVKGCDSICQRYKINVLPIHTDTTTVAICAGETYEFLGKSYSNSILHSEFFTNIHGCDSTLTLNLTVHPLPILKIDIETDERVCLEDQLILTGTGAENYSWVINSNNYGKDNPLETYVSAKHMDIQLFGTNAYDCMDSTSVVVVGEECCEVGIPNAFTPNGDGLNDEFGVITPGNPKRFIFRIFDRWGKEVFVTNQVQAKWDGTVNGQVADAGVYFYMYEIECINGSKRKVITEVM